MDVEITKDAEKMLVALYKAYLGRRKDGQSKREARRFEDDYFSSASPFSRLHPSDVDDTRLELAQCGLLKVYIGGDCELTDIAIVHLENRFKNGLSDVASFIAQFIP